MNKNRLFVSLVFYWGMLNIQSALRLLSEEFVKR